MRGICLECGRSRLSGAVWAARAACVLAVAAVAASAHAAGQPAVCGSLKGYFLRPDGALEIHELPVHGPPQPSCGPALHPLWSSYYFAARVTAPEPIARLRVIAVADGVVLFDRRWAPPACEVRVPAQEGSFLGAHSKHGLAWRFELTLARGARLSVLAGPAGARLLRMPELKIDWLDLIRIAEVRRLLREHGDEILPGFRGDDVPFALEGDEGQWVLLDHPRAPAGFTSYRGPCPVRGDLRYGKAEWVEFGKARGAATEIAGTPTALLPYRAGWCALPVAAGTLRSPWEASQRVLAVVHEAAHVARASRRARIGASLPMEVLVPPSAEARVMAAIERGTIVMASQEDPSRVAALAQQYLALREMRAAQSSVMSEVCSALEELETTEGLAWYAEERAAKALGAAARDSALLRLDPYFAGLQHYLGVADMEGGILNRDPRMIWRLHDQVFSLPTLHGVCQARVVDSLRPDLMALVWRGELASLRQALARACGFDELTPDQRAQLCMTALEAGGWDKQLRLVWRGEERVRAALGHPKAGGEGGGAFEISVSARLPAPLTKMAGWGSYPVCLEGYQVEYNGNICDIQAPCLLWVIQEERGATVRVLTAVDEGTGHLRIEQEGTALSLRTKGVMIAGRGADHSSRAGGTRVRLGAVRTPGDDTSGGEKMNGWRRTVAPVMMLLAISPAMGQCPAGETIVATIQGLFTNACTQQVEFKTLDLLDPPEGAEWLTIVGETYDIHCSVTDPLEACVAEVKAPAPDGQTVADATAAPPVHSLTAEGPWIA